MYYFCYRGKKDLMNMSRRLGLLTLFFAFSVLAWCYQPVQAQANQSQQQAVTKRVFPNGLILLIKQNPGNEVVVVNAFAGMGALYESESERGISKLMQRVMLKGTSTRRAKDIAYQTESVGASIDSGIESYSSGSVSLKTTLAGLDTGLNIFLDILAHPTFPAKEVAKEKTFMAEELKAATDQPVSEAFQNFLKLFYGNLPLGMTPDEIAGNVTHMTREDVLRWYRKIYRPGNLVISIVGNVDPQKIEATIAKTIGGWEKGELPQPAANAATDSREAEDRQMICSRNSQAIFMILGFPAPRIDETDYPAMAVINYIMGSDMGSRLFVELRDKKGLAYNVSTGYEAANYSSYLYTFMATAPANFEAAKTGILHEFSRLSIEPVPESELKIAKTALKGGYLMEHETNSAQNHFLGTYALWGLGDSFDQDYPALIDRVTAADVQQVASKYFQHYALSVVSPVEIKE